MSHKQFFGTDGIRGRVGDQPVSPDFILRLGWATGKVLGRQGTNSNILIGRDTRISGYMLESALGAGLAAAGMNIFLISGAIPTPCIAYLTRIYHVSAGIIISGSHNAYYDNGVKFFLGNGNKLTDEIELAIEAELEKPLRTVSSTLIGKVRYINDAMERYVQFCKNSIPASINFHNLKMIVDCANGATYNIMPKLLQELGSDVISIGNKPNGLNINANIGSLYPRLLQKAVIHYAADLGIALDGDGDRVVLIDSDGFILDGDDILYILAIARQRENRLHGKVVGTPMTNLGLELALKSENIQFYRTQYIGDRYIMEQLIKRNWVLGGEPSGHIICRDYMTTGDGIIAAFQVIAEMIKQKRSLAELRKGIVKYPQELINLPIGRKSSFNTLMKTALVKNIIKIAQEKLGKKGRVLLRPSGTEPLIRIMVEGADRSQVMVLANQIADVIRKAL